MDKILSKYTPIKTHQIVSFFIEFSEGVLPKPLTIRYAVVFMDACRNLCRGVH